MEYAIVIEKTQAVLMMSKNLQIDRNNNNDHNLEVFKGTMVQIKGRQNAYSVVIICDFHEENLAFQYNHYYVKTSALERVEESIWLQLVAIPDPQERANIAKDKSYLEYLSSLKIGTFVSVKTQYFSKCPIRQSLQFLPEREAKDSKDQDFDCIVRYIGFVTEMGPGYYYGLELLVIFPLLSSI